MKVPHPIPYQGSKRNLAQYITPFIPYKTERLIEPFAGSAAISIAAAVENRVNHFWLNDFNSPLINLLEKMVVNPQEVIDRYSSIWNEQLTDSEHFIKVRKTFNKTKEPELLLYLLARCVKNAVRYNNKGEFNQSADNRRKGRSPSIMEKEIKGFSYLMKGKVSFSSEDYEVVLNNATERDLVYMDPPYMGTKGSSRRYIQGLDLERFIVNIDKLNKRNIPFLISFDGKTGQKEYGEELPSFLNLHRIELNAGKSSQATLQGKNETTIESLYISEEAFRLSQLSQEDIFKLEKSSYNNQIELELKW